MKKIQYIFSCTWDAVQLEISAEELISLQIEKVVKCAKLILTSDERNEIGVEMWVVETYDLGAELIQQVTMKIRIVDWFKCDCIGYYSGGSVQRF